MIYQQYVVVKGSCGVRVKTIINILQRKHINCPWSFQIKPLQVKAIWHLIFLIVKKEQKGHWLVPNLLSFQRHIFKLVKHLCWTIFMKLLVFDASGLLWRVFDTEINAAMYWTIGLIMCRIMCVIVENIFK